MFKRFLRDTSGQFAIMFGVASTMLLIAVGVAVDFAGITKEKRRLQDMADSAVLAAASSGEDLIGPLKVAAKDSFDANNIHGLVITQQTSLNGDIVRVEASSKYNAYLMGILGKKLIDVNVVSEAPLPKETPLNIALVLDSTGSMAGANMDALKSASKKLLDVFDSSDPGVIQASVVPFARWVNVGLSNRNRPWMDVDPDSSTTVTPACYDTYDTDYTQCTSTTEDYACASGDGETATCTRTIWDCPDSAKGPTYNYCPPDYTTTDTWYGCVDSRSDPLNKDPDFKGNAIEGRMDYQCGTEILELTDNLTTVGTHIDSMVATGQTFIPAGLIWGWRTLDPDQPFNNLTNSQTDRKRALVLMTDGENSVRLNGTWHDSFYPHETDAATWRQESNDLSAELCQGIKDEGIDVYTVAYQFGAGTSDSKTMLENCASSPNMFFNAANAAELEKAFEEIAYSLFEVRLSR